MTRVKSSHRACATSIRSKGSRWMGGETSGRDGVLGTNGQPGESAAADSRTASTRVSRSPARHGATPGLRGLAQEARDTVTGNTIWVDKLACRALRPDVRVLRDALAPLTMYGVGYKTAVGAPGHLEAARCWRFATALALCSAMRTQAPRPGAGG